MIETLIFEIHSESLNSKKNRREIKKIKITSHKKSLTLSSVKRFNISH